MSSDRSDSTDSKSLQESEETTEDAEQTETAERPVDIVVESQQEEDAESVKDDMTKTDMPLQSLCPSTGGVPGHPDEGVLNNIGFAISQARMTITEAMKSSEYPIPLTPTETATSTDATPLTVSPLKMTADEKPQLLSNGSHVSTATSSPDFFDKVGAVLDGVGDKIVNFFTGAAAEPPAEVPKKLPKQKVVMDKSGGVISSQKLSSANSDVDEEVVTAADATRSSHARRRRLGDQLQRHKDDQKKVDDLRGTAEELRRAGNLEGVEKMDEVSQNLQRKVQRVEQTATKKLSELEDANACEDYYVHCEETREGITEKAAQLGAAATSGMIGLKRAQAAKKKV